MLQTDKLVKSSSVVVRTAIVANRLFLLALFLLLLSSWGFPRLFASLVPQSLPAADASSAITGVRLLILLGIAMSGIADRIFAVLAEMVTTVRAGDPFLAANARKLQSLGWFLLALQLLDIPAAAISHFYPSMGSAAPSGDISVVGWISVLMVFVLSRVFSAGSAMRDELEATV